jgi:hypothetical protein
VHELLVAKAFYLQAVYLRRSPLPFHPEMAVLALQDAVELAAFAAAKSIGVTIPEKADFETYWQLVEASTSGGAPPKTLPLRADMRKLNKARVAFKHHGNAPNIAQIAEHEDNARRFLVAIARDFFGVGLDSLSEIDLVGNAQIRDLLKMAEAHVAADEIQQSLQRCRDALDASREITRPFLRWDRSLRIPSGSREMQPLSEAFAALAKAVVTVEFYVEAILLNVHPTERSLLEAYLPMSHGRGHYMFRGAMPSQEIATKCVQAVTRFAIAAEKFASDAGLDAWGFVGEHAAKLAADARQRGGSTFHTVDKPEKPNE